ncbi:hypothetical protein [Cysteiniphilum sp. 6C5]|uniref:hypothetical protein n=1 Tax=unclassified Cysteiniphilum TaxID=2610889 RepID=UPI003F83BB65
MENNMLSTDIPLIYLKLEISECYVKLLKAPTTIAKYFDIKALEQLYEYFCSYQTILKLPHQFNLETIKHTLPAEITQLIKKPDDTYFYCRYHFDASIEIVIFSQTDTSMAITTTHSHWNHLLKFIDQAEISHTVYRGNPNFTGLVDELPQPNISLTHVESDCFAAMYCDKYSDKELSEFLQLSIRRIEDLISSLKDKFCAKDRYVLLAKINHSDAIMRYYIAKKLMGHHHG